MRLDIQAGVTAASQPKAPEPDAAYRQQVGTAAREFEAMFLLQMLKQMRQSMLDEDSAEPGFGAATMLDTIDSELARHLSGGQGGLSPMLMSSMGVPSNLLPSSVTPGTLPAGLAGSMGMVPALTTALAATTGVAPTVAPAVAPVSAPAAGAATPAAASTPGRIAPKTVSAAGEVAADVSALIEGSRVSSDFGWRKDPFNGARKFHAGVDVRAAYGAAVPSAADGTVVFAGTRRGYGQLVEIEHAPGVRTRYAHLSSIAVTPGAQVSAGDVVGEVGSSGRATGAHLHFELRENGRAVDPDEGLSGLAGQLKVGNTDADYPSGSTRTGSDPGRTR